MKFSSVFVLVVLMALVASINAHMELLGPNARDGSVQASGGCLARTAGQAEEQVLGEQALDVTFREGAGHTAEPWIITYYTSEANLNSNSGGVELYRSAPVADGTAVTVVETVTIPQVTEETEAVLKVEWGANRFGDCVNIRVQPSTLNNEGELAPLSCVNGQEVEGVCECNSGYAGESCDRRSPRRILGILLVVVGGAALVSVGGAMIFMNSSGSSSPTYVGGGSSSSYYKSGSSGASYKSGASRRTGGSSHRSQKRPHSPQRSSNRARSPKRTQQRYI